MLTFAFMRHLYLVGMLFGMPSLHLYICNCFKFCNYIRNLVIAKCGAGLHCYCKYCCTDIAGK